MFGWVPDARSIGLQLLIQLRHEAAEDVHELGSGVVLLLSVIVELW